MLLVERNHGQRLHPNLVCASDFRDTAESFNTVALHSRALHNAIIENSHRVSDSVRQQFTRELRHLCSSMGVPVPFLPVPHSMHEAKLFTTLILTMPGSFDAEAMAIEWCKHIDGINLFPKLPTHLRTYHEQWARNRRIEDAVKNMGPALDRLTDVNEEHQLPDELVPAAAAGHNDEPAQTAQDDDDVLPVDDGDGFPLFSFLSLFSLSLFSSSPLPRFLI